MSNLPDDLKSLLAALGGSDFHASLTAMSTLLKNPRSITKEALPSLLETLKKGGDTQRANAARVIRVLGADAIEALMDLMGSLKDGSSEVRAAASSAIGGIGPAAGEAAPLLAATFKEADDLNIRASVIKALGSLKVSSGDVIKVLIRGLDDKSYVVRSSAARSLKDGLGTVPTGEFKRTSWDCPQRWD